MKNLLLTSLLILLVGEIASHPTSVITSGSLEKNTDLPAASVNQDSHLERVHVKQETGFDGKVRSIRFSLEPEKDVKQVGARVNHADNIVPEVVASSSESNSKSSSDNSFSASDTAPSSRSRRSIDQQSTKNTLDDLQAEEAKVFRPLFVYRQQVAKRLKLRNDRKPSNSRPRVQRTYPNSNRYYYPCDYQYRYVPYEYPRY